MRIPALLVALVTAFLAFPMPAQQAVPDAPQPQKKQPEKAPDPPPPPPPARDDNAFPEDQSKAAADNADQRKTSDDNAFPEDQSKAAADAAKQDKPASPAQNANPFPEDQSRAAAKAAGNDGSQKPVVPVHDPARARKDNEVGKFYLDKGDYQGALLRYQDATAVDPSNADAILGLAQAQHNLKNDAEALKNYELFLRIVPEGPKAKQALKALKEIERGK